MEYMEDEYLTNSYSLVIKVFDNGSEGFYNTEDIFENYNSNRTVDPNFTLLNVDSPINENILDFSDDNSETRTEPRLNWLSGSRASLKRA
ncbi:2189_t:CDS:2 [Rhizophagus irregularis]|nr:2189_t:CDS:2 [Rhizophagus irregularis]